MSFRRNVLRNVATNKDGAFNHLKSSSDLRVPLANSNDLVPSNPVNLTAQYPPGGYEEGSFIYNQANNTPYVRTNASGIPTWSLLGGGGGGGETLAQTLALGNVTGGSNIVMSTNMTTGDQITGTNSALILSDPNTFDPAGALLGARLESNFTNTFGGGPPFNGTWIYGGNGTVGGGNQGGTAGVIGGNTPAGAGNYSGSALIVAGDPGATGNSGSVTLLCQTIPVGNTTGTAGEVFIGGSEIGDPGNGNVGGNVNIGAGDSNGTGNGGNVNLQGGNGLGNGAGGGIALLGGGANVGNGGDIGIFGGGTSPMGGTGGNVRIEGGNTNSPNNGGDVEIDGGSGGNDGGQITLSGGGGQNLGGNATLSAGAGDGGGGLTTVNGGNAITTGNGGNVQIEGGSTPSGNGGTVTVLGGAGPGTGGSVSITAGNSTGLGGGGNIVLTPGIGPTQQGDVIITGNSVAHLISRQTSLPTVNSTSGQFSMGIVTGTDIAGSFSFNDDGAGIGRITIDFSQTFKTAETPIVIFTPVNNASTVTDYYAGTIVDMMTGNIIAFFLEGTGTGGGSNSFNYHVIGATNAP